MLFVVEESMSVMDPGVACIALTYCGGEDQKNHSSSSFTCTRAHVSTQLSFSFSLCLCSAHVTVHVYGLRRVLMG